VAIAPHKLNGISANGMNGIGLDISGFGLGQSGKTIGLFLGPLFAARAWAGSSKIGQCVEAGVAIFPFDLDLGIASPA
jgi:hypothetical protein